MSVNDWRRWCHWGIRCTVCLEWVTHSVQQTRRQDCKSLQHSRSFTVVSVVEPIHLTFAYISNHMHTLLQETYNVSQRRVIYFTVTWGRLPQAGSADLTMLQCPLCVDSGSQNVADDVISGHAESRYQHTADTAACWGPQTQPAGDTPTSLAGL